MKCNKVIKTLKDREVHRNLPFGISLFFIGLTLNPEILSSDAKKSLSCIFIVLGAWVITVVFLPKKGT